MSTAFGAPIYVQLHTLSDGRWLVEAGWSHSVPPQLSATVEPDSRIGRAATSILRQIGEPPTLAQHDAEILGAPASRART